MSPWKLVLAYIIFLQIESYTQVITIYTLSQIWILKSDWIKLKDKSEWSLFFIVFVFWVFCQCCVFVLFTWFESSPSSFRSGATIACLNWGGTIHVERYALTVTVINKTRSLRHCFVMEIGIGSSMQLFVSDIKMILLLVFWSLVQTERAVGHQKQKRSVAHISVRPGRHKYGHACWRKSHKTDWAAQNGGCLIGEVQCWTCLTVRWMRWINFSVNLKVTNIFVLGYYAQCFHSFFTPEKECLIPTTWVDLYILIAHGLGTPCNLVSAHHVIWSRHTM